MVNKNAKIDVKGNRTTGKPDHPNSNFSLQTIEGYSVYKPKQKYRIEKGHKGALKCKDTELIYEDIAFQNYMNYLKQRGSNRGRLNTRCLTHYARAVAHFCEFCKLEVTNHTLSDLIQAKQNNPNDFQIEQALRKYCSIEIHTMHRIMEASYICGIFNRGNFTQLKIHINTHYIPDKEEIPETTLRSIFRETTPEMQVIQELQTFLGERIYAIAHLTPNDFNLDIDPNYAVAYFNGEYTKNHIIHFSICPKQSALKAIAIANKTHRKFLFPNYANLWRKITNYALKQYGVRYTSHYLRTRFETIADDTGISMNKVNYLMGGAPHGSDDSAKLGHLPKIYILKEARKYVSYYDKFLAKPLSLIASESDVGACA